MEPVTRHPLLNVARIVAGFVIIGIGIAGLVLPGPGFLVVIVGLGLLPFEWSRSITRALRSRIPGIPAEGRLPLSAWINIVVLIAAAAAVTILFGDEIRAFISSLFD